MRKFPPNDLQSGGKSLWRSVVDAGYSLDPLEYVLLHQLCRTADILDRISAELATMGVVVAGSEKQPVANKLLNEMREQNKVFDQLQRALALPVAGEHQGKRRSGDAKRTAKAGRPMKSNRARVSHLVRQEGA